MMEQQQSTNYMAICNRVWKTVYGIKSFVISKIYVLFIYRRKVQGKIYYKFKNYMDLNWRFKHGGVIVQDI